MNNSMKGILFTLVVVTGTVVIAQSLYDATMIQSYIAAIGSAAFAESYMVRNNLFTVKD